VSSSGSSDRPTFDGFLTLVDQGQVERATMRSKSQDVAVGVEAGEKVTIWDPGDFGGELTNILLDDKVSFVLKRRGGAAWLGFLITLAPFVLFLVFWVFLMNQMQGGGSKVMSFGKARAKRMSVDSPKITFRDVAGAEEAVEELHEIKEFLENPKKFQAL